MTTVARLLLRTPTGRLTMRTAATHSEDKHATWRELNRLCAERKWDHLNNCPKFFLTGQAAKEANALYFKIEDKTGVFDKRPYGVFLKAIFRIASLFAVLYAGYGIYCVVFPETYRYAYKYRPKHDHGHEDGHGHAEGGHY